MPEIVANFHPYPDPQCRAARDGRAYHAGACYVLPDGWTWETVAGHRAAFGCAPPLAPLGGAAGVVAWGTVFESNLKIAG